MRILRDVICWPNAQICEITPPTTGDSNFFADCFRVVNKQHASAALPRTRRAEEAGGTGSDDDGVKCLLHAANVVGAGIRHRLASRDAVNITLSPVQPPLPPPSPPANNSSAIVCVLYAMRTIFRVLPAIGRSSDHANAPPGLSLKHFVVAGALCALMLVSTLLGLVSLVIRLVR